jgi:hypothetical protein
MHLRQFVSGSAVILSAWLAVTFVTEVPTQRYPKLDKYERQSTRADHPEQSHIAATAQPEIFPVSISQ